MRLCSEIMHWRLIAYIAALSRTTAKIYDSFSELPSRDFDFIVAGGGTAGLVVANRLSEDSRINVLVIEAGGSHHGFVELEAPWLASRLHGGQFDWNTTTTPQPELNGRSLLFSRGRVLGGSSSHNGMIWTRGSSDDFDRWAEITGDEGWSWKEMGPYFKKTEHWTIAPGHGPEQADFDPHTHGFHGPLGISLNPILQLTDPFVIQTTKDLSHEFPFIADANAGRMIGVGWTQFSIINGTRASSATAYLDPVVDRPNLSVLINSQVTRIFETSKGSFRTVEFASNQTAPRKRLIASKELILSAGVVGTPQILLNSGIGDPTELSKFGLKPLVSLPSVGKNFSTEPNVGFSWAAKGPILNINANETASDEALQQWLESRTGPMTSGGESISAYIRLPPDSPAFVGSVDPSSGPNTPHCGIGLNANGYFSTSPDPMLVVRSEISEPASRGFVTLNSTDPFQLPVVDPGVYTAPVDLAIAMESFKTIQRYVTAPAWQNFTLSQLVPPPTVIPGSEELAEYLRNSTGISHHGIGTSAMSARGADHGVVDPDLRVKRVLGLRIVDAGVIPFNPAANTQAPVYAIAERAADLIKATWNMNTGIIHAAQRSCDTLMRWHSLLYLVALSCVKANIYEDFSELPSQNFDFIIAGGGTAGLVVANRLTEDPSVHVLVIEAGESHEGILALEVPWLSSTLRVNGAPFDWNTTTTPQDGLNGRSILYSRARVLGGCSSHNGMIWIRGSSDDWDKWARFSGDKGWSWEGMLPYFEKTERWTVAPGHGSERRDFNPRVHGFKGPLGIGFNDVIQPTDPLVMQTTKDLPNEFPFLEDLNAGRPIGAGWTQFSIANGTRTSSATAYLDPVNDRPNLSVLVNTYVTRIIETSNGSFKTVEFAQNQTSPRQNLTASKEVILSAGAIGTPQILLNSGVGDPTDLKQTGVQPVFSLPSVGKNLSCEPHVPFTWAAKGPTLNLNANQTAAQDALQEWIANRTGPMTGSGWSTLTYVRLPDDSPVFNGHEDPSAGPNTPHFGIGINANGYYIMTPDPTLYVTSEISEPASRGSVSLKSTNPFDLPALDLGFFSAPVDLAIAKESFSIIQRFVTSPAWANFTLGLLGPSSNITGSANHDSLLVDYIRNSTISASHAIGTSSMSPKGASFGVVDPDLRVKGIRGLRIVDAGIIPFSPSANTQAPVYAIAERASDIIKAEWKLSHRGY
ncbi:hypothetical protein NP233_g878 [Leucocoprinus birnbaumii]|uniref:pyranose dehydrogenase (acceptor) n=1 Tax=Leucocoprinus birnbaumii TaxID=56174 RepID=A0AAD5W3T6_9AGAR|nr:hypothetical protein NP233_g878 [Leucocoprinus birnbaumii]